jgi:hypothetical protein
LVIDGETKPFLKPTAAIKSATVYKKAIHGAKKHRIQGRPWCGFHSPPGGGSGLHDRHQCFIEHGRTRVYLFFVLDAPIQFLTVLLPLAIFERGAVSPLIVYAIFGSRMWFAIPWLTARIITNCFL